jgi:hypothetical protein
VVLRVRWLGMVCELELHHDKKNRTNLATLHSVARNHASTLDGSLHKRRWHCRPEAVLYAYFLLNTTQVPPSTSQALPKYHPRTPVVNDPLQLKTVGCSGTHRPPPPPSRPTR